MIEVMKNKKIILSSLVVLMVICTAVIFNCSKSQAASASLEICPGSGVCCGTLYDGTTQIDLVKDGDSGGVVIKDKTLN